MLTARGRGSSPCWPSRGESCRGTAEQTRVTVWAPPMRFPRLLHWLVPLDRVLRLADLGRHAVLGENRVPQHKDQHGPQPAAVSRCYTGARQACDTAAMSTK